MLRVDVCVLFDAMPWSYTPQRTSSHRFALQTRIRPFFEIWHFSLRRPHVWGANALAPLRLRAFAESATAGPPSTKTPRFDFGPRVPVLGPSAAMRPDPLWKSAPARSQQVRRAELRPGLRAATRELFESERVALPLLVRPMSLARAASKRRVLPRARPPPHICVHVISHHHHTSPSYPSCVERRSV